MYSIWIDGAARGNPGPASAAGVVKDGSELVAEWGVPLGIRTNNEAEYTGLLLALLWLTKHPSEALIQSDSQLLVEQISGRWKVKSENLIGLHALAKKMLRTLPPVKIVAVRRAFNKEADALANMALDKKQLIAAEDFKTFIPPLIDGIF